ncbi:MAG TPA: restriction endonuclease [Longimicrobium sp.]|nr:restriction endonuclease [Longimicrobium sp.]
MGAGSDFEIEVMSRLQMELQSGALGILPESARIYHQRAYRVPTQKSPMKVDVALEVFRAGAAEPYFRWIWECKSSLYAVKVDAVREFHARLEQIGADTTKGTIVSRGPFQRGALEQARAWGIGVAVMRPSGQLVHVYESRVPGGRAEVEAGICAESPLIVRAPFLGLTGDGIPAESFEAFVRHGLRADALLHGG